MHKFNPGKRRMLGDPKTFFFENPDEIISEAGVKTAEVVSDIGCGTSLFTIPLSKYHLPFLALMPFRKSAMTDGGPLMDEIQ
jgi:hypothetical protein